MDPNYHVFPYVYTPKLVLNIISPVMIHVARGTTVIGTRDGPKKRVSSLCLDTVFAPECCVPPENIPGKYF